MGKKSGNPKTGGRQKGTGNTRTQELMDLFDEYAEVHGDPVLTLFEIQGNKDLEPSLRLRVAVDLLPYRYPRRRAVDVAAEDRPGAHSISDLVTQRLQYLLGEDCHTGTDHVNTE